MGGLATALNTAKLTLSANRKGIEVAGNNISNVNTPGYSRQRMLLGDTPSVEYGGVFIGQGVRVEDIRREQNVFIQAQLVSKNADQGFANSQSVPLAEVERIISINESSLTFEIDEFFDSWQELSNNPSGQIERQIVLQNGELLAESFNEVSTQLDNAQENINSILLSKVDGINAKLKEVADLNQRISTIEAMGLSPNSFLDQRDLLLQEISQSLGITSYASGNGMVSVQLPSGLPLVDGQTAYSLSAQRLNGKVELSLQYGSSNATLDASKVGGEIKGLLQVRDNFIPAVRSDVDRLAYSIVNAVNGVHQAGTDLAGGAGGLFFNAPAVVPPPGNPWDGMANSMSMLLGEDETDRVAAGTGGGVGDNRNALAMVGLQQAAAVGSDTFSEFYGKLAARVGLEVQQNELTLGGTEDALVQLNNLRDSTVGVSIEEEMISLVQYQQGFEAAAKLLSTVDEMMESILALKR